MGFTWIHLNPVHYPGFSGSLYAVKDFYELNPLFVSEGCQDAMGELRDTLAAMHDQGLRVMMDLVVNHTAKDSPLVKEHPTWFRRDDDGYVVSPSAIDPADSRKVTVWGDLAEIDNTNSPQRQALWAHWTALVQYYLDLGFDGFRCDAAYKVPARLWQLLISAGRRHDAEVLFAAETLGCRLAEVRGLRAAGFDYLFNSSKWWNFDQPWALDQHAEFGEIAPSISFPETHDTRRLFDDTEGLLQVQKQRYLLAAAFASGLLMPVGYEFGFKKKLDVVETMPDDWETDGPDLSAFIRGVNSLFGRLPAFGAEGRWEVLTDLDSATTLLCKRAKGSPPLVLAINKDWLSPQVVTLPALTSVFGHIPPTLYRLFDETTARSGDIVTETAPSGARLTLAPAEIAILSHEGS